MGLFGKKTGKKSKAGDAAASYTSAEDISVGPVDIVETSQTNKQPAVMTTGSDSSEDSKKKALLGDEEVAGSDEHSSEENKPLSEKLMEHLAVFWAAILGCCGLPKVLVASLAAGAGVGIITYLVATRGQAPIYPAKVNVAFVGNSYFYVNDLPRFVENIAAGGHLFQDSVLHNSASILEIIMTGNGMWSKWATKNAMIGGVKFETEQGTTEYLYDMGACSVPQLLTGHDKLVTSGDALGSFMNDGENPCFVQDAYLEYQESFNYKGGWDFVVVTDQAKRMCFDETRHEALAAFNYTYGPLCKKGRISPIIVQPHAYQSEGSNATGLSDLPTFTALIMEGAQVYKKYLNKRVGFFQGAHIAPVGNAFLAVYEADEDLYQKLFLDDGIHPSAYGTYLYGTVIYATMMGYMPRYKDVVVDGMNSTLFGTARRLQADDSQAGFPDKEEAAVLFKLAKKVALGGYKPKSIRGFKPEVNAQEFIEEEVDDGSYEGDYNVEVYSSQNYNPYYQDGNNGGYNGYNDYYVDQNYGNNGGYNGQYGGQYGANNNYNAQQQYQGAYGGNNNYNGQYGANNGYNYNGQYGANNYNGQYGANNYNGQYGNRK